MIKKSAYLILISVGSYFIQYDIKMLLEVDSNIKDIIFYSFRELSNLSLVFFCGKNFKSTLGSGLTTTR